MGPAGILDQMVLIAKGLYILSLWPPNKRLEHTSLGQLMELEAHREALAIDPNYTIERVSESDPLKALE